MPLPFSVSAGPGVALRHGEWAWIEHFEPSKGTKIELLDGKYEGEAATILEKSSAGGLRVKIESSGEEAIIKRSAKMRTRVVHGAGSDKYLRPLRSSNSIKRKRNSGD